MEKIDVSGERSVSVDYLHIKVNFTLEQATKAQREQMYSSNSSFNLGARGGGWSTPSPGRSTRGKGTVPIV
jgi:hypothetical protein